MMFSLMEVLLSAPLLHHAVKAVAVTGEGGQLVEAAPGEDLGVPGDQEVATRPQALVPAISLASRQPPEVVTAAAAWPGLLVILLRGEGVAVVAVIVVVSVPLLVVSLTELMVATLTPMVTKLIAPIMVMVITTVVWTIIPVLNIVTTVSS